MNGKQAIVHLKVRLNQLDTASNRTVRAEQALLFLNDAYLKLAKAKYEKSNPQDKTAFQFNQKVTDELNHLTRNYTGTPTEVEGVYSIDTSDIENYWVGLRLTTNVVSGTHSGWVTPTIKTLDTLSTAQNDPFNEPYPQTPIAYYEEGKVKVEGAAINSIKVTYLRYPQPIEMDVEIPAPFVDEIVEFAAIMMLENWSDQRAQSKLSINKVVENE